MAASDPSRAVGAGSEGASREGAGRDGAGSAGADGMLELGGADDVHALQGAHAAHAVHVVHARYASVGRVAVARLAPEVTRWPAEVQRAAFHEAVQHLLPGGLLVHPPDLGLDGLAAEFDLHEPVAGDEVAWPGCRVWRRTSRTTIHDLVHEARAVIDRVSPLELAERLASHCPPLVIDTRTHTDRERFGVIEGSIHAPRTVLEWHLDPANGYRHPLALGFDDPIVVVCNGGYSSSLAAANLVRLGFTDVADLVGGVHAWRLAGLQVTPPDHAHLDL